MKKILMVLSGVAIGFSLLAFTPAGSSSQKADAVDIGKEVKELKIQVADLNLRVAKLEAAATEPAPKKKSSFQPN
jgi:outer membrane murein-binding lipoprotein Lpp